MAFLQTLLISFATGFTTLGIVAYLANMFSKRYLMRLVVEQVRESVPLFAAQHQAEVEDRITEAFNESHTMAQLREWLLRIIHEETLRLCDEIYQEVVVVDNTESLVQDVISRGYDEVDARDLIAEWREPECEYPEGYVPVSDGGPPPPYPIPNSVPTPTYDGEPRRFQSEHIDEESALYVVGDATFKHGPFSAFRTAPEYSSESLTSASDVADETSSTNVMSTPLDEEALSAGTSQLPPPVQYHG